MVLCLVIPQDTSQPLWLEQANSIDHFQLLVDGWLDFVEIPALGVTVYMNARGRSSRPMNTRATALWWYYSADPTEYPVLLGDVVVTGSSDEEGRHDLPGTLGHLLLERDRFVVQVSPYGDGDWHDSLASFDNFFDAATWCLLFDATLRRGPQFRIKPETSGTAVTRGHETGGEWS